MKTCSLCNESFHEGEFYKDRRSPDGLTRRCRTCHSKKSYESRKKSTRPHARRDYDRALRMKRDYGITVEDYHALEKSQGYVCAICKKPESNRWSVDVPFSLAVDHDHNTGIVRGLLCGNCNTGIGKFYDSKELLESAIRYLDRAPEGGK